MFGAERLSHPIGKFGGNHDAAGIRLGDEVPQQLATRRGVERYRHNTELAETPDRPDEFGAVRKHDGDMVALSNAVLEKSICVTVRKFVRLLIGVALLAKDKPGPI